MKYLALLLLVFLSGCASTPAVQSPVALAPTHGYVYVNLPADSSLNGGIKLRSLKDKREYQLPARSQGARGYGLWLPEGDYQISEWRGTPLRNYPTFAVQARRVTSLGSVLSIQVGGYALVVLPIQHSEDAALAQQVANEYQSYLISPEPILWKPEGMPKPVTPPVPSTGLGIVGDLLMAYDRSVNETPLKKRLLEAQSIDEFFQLAKLIMPPVTEAVLDSESNTYFGADLGQVRRRNRDGLWSSLDTGTLRTITAVAISGKTLLAGSDDGVLRASTDNGKTWQRVAAVAQDEAIVGIHRIGHQWLVAASHWSITYPGWKQSDQLKVYSAAADNFSDLAISRQFPMPGLAPNYYGSNGGQVAGHYFYLTAFPGLWRLDLTTQEWVSVTPPITTSGFNANPSGSVLAAYLAQGIFSKLFISTDFGNSWTQYNEPMYAITNIYFDTPEDGRATRIRADTFSAVFEIQQYDRSHNRWQKKYEAPAGCERLLWIGGAPHYCITKGGSILRNEGTEWKAEFTAE